MIMLRSKISNAPKEQQFKLRRKHKEDYLKVGESKVGVGYRIVNSLCSLECGSLPRGLKKRNFKSVLTEKRHTTVIE